MRLGDQQVDHIDPTLPYTCQGEYGGILVELLHLFAHRLVSQCLGLVSPLMPRNQEQHTPEAGGTRGAKGNTRRSGGPSSKGYIGMGPIPVRQGQLHSTLKPTH